MIIFFLVEKLHCLDKEENSTQQHHKIVWQELSIFACVFMITVHEETIITSYDNDKLTNTHIYFF